jgi:hypothetical protein
MQPIDTDQYGVGWMDMTVWVIEANTLALTYAPKPHPHQINPTPPIPRISVQSLPITLIFWIKYSGEKITTVIGRK